MTRPPRSRIANWLALAVPLLALHCPGQTTRPGSDWQSTLHKAQHHRRIMLRRAAAHKVAAAGAAAVPAVRAYSEQHGRNALRIELVSAYGKTQVADPATMSLLRSWAADRNFYWRSQALAALANRRRPELQQLFASHLADPAYLTRIQAGRGLCRLGVEPARVFELLRDTDPRVRLRIALCIVEEHDDRGLPTLVEALRQQGSFLEYPWGQLGALVAFKALRKQAEQDFDYTAGASSKENHEAIAGFEKWARARLGQRWVAPMPASVDTTEYIGGLELRSCRNGDLFLRWTADHQLVVGLEGRLRRQLDGNAARQLKAGLPFDGANRHGKVVCDFLRLLGTAPKRSQKSAPGALPAESAEWLESLAKALDKNDKSGLGRRIASRLDQFRSPRRP